MNMRNRLKEVVAKPSSRRYILASLISGLCIITIIISSGGSRSAKRDGPLAQDVFTAVEQRDVDRFEQLANSSNINNRAGDGRTLLQHIICLDAVTSDQKRLMVGVALEKGANVNEVIDARSGSNILLAAIQCADGSVIRLLTERGVSIHQGPNAVAAAVTLLHPPARRDVVDALLDNPDVDINYLSAKDESGFSAIDYAKAIPEADSDRIHIGDRLGFEGQLTREQINDIRRSIGSPRSGPFPKFSIEK